MSVLLVIPARYASSRFPGKPLIRLRGVRGAARSLIRRSWDAAMAIPEVDRVVIATDDDRIAAVAHGFGAEVAMTPGSCRNGTERCAAVLGQLDTEAALVVNFQGDALLTPPWFVSRLVIAMLDDPDLHVATPVLRCDAVALEGLLEDRRHGRVGGTTAVIDRSGCALYFSKEVLPFIGRTPAGHETIPVFHHVGVYAYRPHALLAYPDWPLGPLETWEGLEQLRFLENGTRVRCVEVEAQGRVFWEVNNPSDVPRIEAILAQLGMD